MPKLKWMMSHLPSQIRPAMFVVPLLVGPQLAGAQSTASFSSDRHHPASSFSWTSGLLLQIRGDRFAEELLAGRLLLQRLLLI
jgi:hypothetical protein